MKLVVCHWFPLLSRILEVAPQYATITYDRSLGAVSGTAYKNYIISEICSCNWPKESLCEIPLTFKSVPLDSEEARIVVTKLVKQLGRVKLSDSPHYVNHVLTIASACNLIDVVLHKVVDFFNELDDTAKEGDMLDSMDTFDGEFDDHTVRRSDVLSAESILLLCISNTVRHNLKLGKAIVKLLKTAKECGSEQLVTPFTLSLAFALAHDTRFHDDVHNILRSIILKCYQTERKVDGSKWLAEHVRKTVDIKSCLRKVASNSKREWTVIREELIEFCFGLLSAYGQKAGAFGKGFAREIRKQATAQQDVCDLSIHLLAHLFKSHDSAQPPITKRILHTLQISVALPAYHHIDLLKAVVKVYPQAMVQSINQVKMAVEDVAIMHPYNVERLISALMPVVRVNSSLRDSLMLVLRKSLSSKEVTARRSGLQGFLLFLRHFPLEGAISYSQISSQSSQSIFSSAGSSQSLIIKSQSSQRPINNEFLCLEILQLLRRCLQQQCSVRRELYLGLSVVTSSNPLLAPFIIEHLMRQSKSYCNNSSQPTENDITAPPIKFGSCATRSGDTTVLNEPLATLLQSTHLCLHQANNDENGIDPDEIFDRDCAQKVAALFDHLTERMIKCEIDDFQIDKTSDYSNNTATGQKNSIILQQLVAVYQVLLEYNYLHHDLTVEHARKYLQLFESWKHVHDVIVTHKTRFAGRWFVELQLTSSYLGFHARLVHDMFCEAPVTSEAGIEVLQESDDFQKYVMTSLSTVLTFLKDHGYFPGFGACSKTKVMTHVSKCARACLHKFMIEKNDVSRSPVTLLAVKNFHTALQYVQLWRESKLNEFLSSACGEECDHVTQMQHDDDSSAATVLIYRLQRAAITLLTADGAHRKVLGEVVALLESLLASARLLGLRNTVLRTATWWKNVCVEYAVADGATAKCVLSTHLTCAAAAAGDEVDARLREACAEARRELGSIEGYEGGDDGRSSYKIVQGDNVEQLATVVVSHLESAFADMEWLLQWLKARLAVVAPGSGAVITGSLTGSNRKSRDGDGDEESELQEHRRKIEGAICSRLYTTLNGMLELAQSAANSAACVDAFLRCFTTAFTFLASLCKYYVRQHGAASAGGVRVLPNKFEKLCRFVGGEVMRPVYDFIMHAEVAQTERLDSTRSKQLGKKKKDKTAGGGKTFAAGKARVMRESKAVASLIYAVEQHEHQLILLSKKCKLDLMRSHHLSTARDFRIRADVLRLTVAEQQADKENEQNEDPMDVGAEEEVVEEGVSSDEEEEESRSKRSRVGV